MLEAITAILATLLIGVLFALEPARVRTYCVPTYYLEWWA